MTGAEAIARVLKAEGTEYLFCFPVNALIDECAKLDIRPIVTRTERTLLNMADAYARVTNGRKIGVGTVQYGPGAENAYAGIAQAYADGSPLLFLPGGFPVSHNDIPPNFHAAVRYQGITKWSAQINAAKRIPQMLRRAYTLLRSGRPAPVALEIPIDVAKEETEAVNYAPVPPLRSAADPADVREAVRLLLKAQRPLLHVGQGVLWAEAWDELRAFAEFMQVPVMTTLPGKSAFPENHPLAIGTGGYAGTTLVDHYLKTADVICGIGCSFTSTVFAAPIPTGKTIVHITNNEADLNKDVTADHAVLGDAKLVLRQMLEEAQKQGRPHRPTMQQEIAAHKEAWLKQWLPLLTSDETPINPYRVVHDLIRTMDRQRTIITHDAGMPRDQLAPFWETLIPRGYIGWGKTTQLGSSLGFAMGAKLAAPDKVAVHFLGDTALGMCGMDLETAVRERIPILTVLINNGLMGGYEKHIPVATHKYRSRYLSGQYTRVADGLGLAAERVTEPNEIVPALQRALALVAPGGNPAAPTARPALVEIITREETRLSKPW